MSRYRPCLTQTALAQVSHAVYQKLTVRQHKRGTFLGMGCPLSLEFVEFGVII